MVCGIWQDWKQQSLHRSSRLLIRIYIPRSWRKLHDWDTGLHQTTHLWMGTSELVQ